jgi:hypothetical protein
MYSIEIANGYRKPEVTTNKSIILLKLQMARKPEVTNKSGPSPSKLQMVRKPGVASNKSIIPSKLQMVRKPEVNVKSQPGPLQSFRKSATSWAKTTSTSPISPSKQLPSNLNVTKVRRSVQSNKIVTSVGASKNGVALKKPSVSDSPDEIEIVDLD